MRKLCVALVLILAFASPALALMDYIKLRGTWEVKGNIYEAVGHDGGPVIDAPSFMPPEKSLVEIATINPFVVEIGVIDFWAGYADWTEEERKKGLAAFEAFLTNGITANINDAIGQLTKTPYLFLPNISKLPSGPYVPGDWAGIYSGKDSLNFPTAGSLLCTYDWVIGDLWEKSGPKTGYYFWEDVVLKTFAGLNIENFLGAEHFFGEGIVHFASIMFAEETEDKLQVRAFSVYWPAPGGDNYQDVNYLARFYKLTMERR